MGHLPTNLRDLLKKKLTRRINRRISLCTFALVMKEKSLRIQKEAEEKRKN